MKSQRAHLDRAHAAIAEKNETMLGLLFGPNAITDAELSALIAKRPSMYGRYATYIGKR